MTNPLLAGQHRECWSCGALHEVARIATIKLQGATTVVVDAFLCSNDCWADLCFAVPQEVPDAKRQRALSEMMAGI